MKRFRNFIAFTLAQLVLFSTTSFAIEVHKCDGKIYDISITGHANSCDVATMTCDVELDNGEAVKSLYCCSQIHLIANAKTVKKETNKQLSQKQLDFVGILFDSSNQKEERFIINKNFSKNYSPPFISDNINILYQVFLI